MAAKRAPTTFLAKGGGTSFGSQNPSKPKAVCVCAGAELGLFLEPLALSQKELVVLVVNNSASVDSAGGSHW